MDITINQTRNILYKISDHGLVSSIRKKDKKKGWYTYFWRIEVLKPLEFLENVLIKRKNQINNQINNRETREFYFCKSCNIEFNQENALLNNFTCNECGGIFDLRDNTKLLKELKKNSTKIGNELNLIEEEIKKEKIRLEKERQREIVKVKKKAAEARKAREVERKKALRKVPKKLVKKKTAKTKKRTKKKIKKKSVEKKFKKIVKESGKKSVKKR